MERVGFLLIGLASLIGSITWSYKEIRLLQLDIGYYESCETLE
jgi:hypothetical protein